MHIDTVVALVGGLVALVMLEVTRLIYKRLNKQKLKVAWEIGFMGFLLYLLLLATITIFPLHINPYIEIPKHWAINIIPFFSTYKLIIAQESIYFESYMRNFWITNIIGNLLLLLPLGLLLPILYKKFRDVKKTVLVGFSVSISIEIIQLLSSLFGNRRAFDIDDIILNTLGCLLGVLIYRYVISKLYKKWKANNKEGI